MKPFKLLSGSKWPEDGIQPGRIESEFNRLLKTAHYKFCEAQVNEHIHNSSSIRVESIENSHQEEDAVIAVLEVIHVASRYGLISRYTIRNFVESKALVLTKRIISTKFDG